MAREPGVSHTGREIAEATQVPPDLPEHAGELCPLHRRLDEAAAAVERAFRDTRISELVPQAQENRAASDCAPCAFPAGARRAE